MGIYDYQWSRRKFLGSVAGTGALMALNPYLSWALENEDPKVAAIVAKTMGIDTHNHVDVPLNAAELPGPKADLASELKKSGLSAICATFAVDYQKLVNPGDAYNRFITGLDAMDIMLKDNGMKRALNMADLTAAKKAKQPIVIQSVEGCHFLEGDAGRVQVAYDRGLRHLGLLHDNDASVPLGDVYTNDPKYGGLTKLGADTIAECNRLGIVIDLAHASNDTIDMAFKVSKTPMFISHTGLSTQLGANPFMAKMMRPRLISPEQAKKVADAGGVIGVWTHLADTPAEFAKNMRAMVNAAGIEHVCIGTDTKITAPYRSPNDKWGGPGGSGGDKKPEGQPKEGDKPQGKPEGDKKDGGKPQGGPGGKRVGERTNEAWADQKTGFYYAVVDALLKEKFTEEEIGKIGGGNFCRVFNDATKGH
ncbi:dipeptidase [Flavobacterium sp. RHBU_3]|uniref:dipeptidase n=1 Tax=Flavobacterium sp. RHBU_3 TaxID=3391184 RepID=UPI0039852FF8